LEDLEQHPGVAPQALKYLRNFRVGQQELDALLSLCRRGADPELGIHVARFVGDARFESEASDKIANFAVYKVKANDERHGAGYEKGQWLLALHKHGKRRHRDRVLAWASAEKLEDEQLRLHFLYVFLALGELPLSLFNQLRHFSNSDCDLALKICAAAREGTLTNRKQVLARCLGYFNGARVIEARYLPFLRLALGCEANRRENTVWLASILEPKKPKLRIKDGVVVRFLRNAQRRMLE